MSATADREGEAPAEPWLAEKKTRREPRPPGDTASVTFLTKITNPMSERLLFVHSHCDMNMMTGSIGKERKPNRNQEEQKNGDPDDIKPRGPIDEVIRPGA